jgi:hypothetical protein
MEEFIGFVNKLYIHTRMKTQNKAGHVPAANQKSRCLHVQWLLPNQNTVPCKMQQELNSIARQTLNRCNCLGLSARTKTFWTLFVKLQKKLWYLKLHSLNLCLFFWEQLLRFCLNSNLLCNCSDYFILVVPVNCFNQLITLVVVQSVYSSYKIF